MRNACQALIRPFTRSSAKHAQRVAGCWHLRNLEIKLAGHHLPDDFRGQAADLRRWGDVAAVPVRVVVDASALVSVGACQQALELTQTTSKAQKFLNEHLYALGEIRWRVDLQADPGGTAAW